MQEAGQGIFVESRKSAKGKVRVADADETVFKASLERGQKAEGEEIAVGSITHPQSGEMAVRPRPGG